MRYITVGANELGSIAESCEREVGCDKSFEESRTDFRTCHAEGLLRLAE